MPREPEAPPIPLHPHDASFDFVKDESGARSFRLVGELDLANVGRFSSRLEQAPEHGRDVCLDLSALDFLDSAGCLAFVNLSKKLDDGTKLVLSNPRPIVEKVLTLIGVQAFPKIELRGPEPPAIA